MKTEKFTGPNKVLLVLGQRTGAHHEDRHKLVLGCYIFLQLEFLTSLLNFRYIFKNNSGSISANSV